MSTLATQLKKMYWQQRHNGPLPSEYRRVAYLESTGEQWIDTGVMPKLYTYDCDVATMSSGNVMYWGQRDSSDGRDLNRQCYMNSNNNQQVYRKIHLYTTTVAQERTGYRDNWDSGIVPTIGTMYQLRNATTVDSHIDAVNYPIILFGANLYGNKVLSSVRIGMWLCYNPGGDIRSYVPCVRTADGKPGMYDLCGSVCPLTNSPFYVNSGTGQDFTWEELS